MEIGVDPQTMSRLKDLILPPAEEWQATMAREMAAIEEHWKDSLVGHARREFAERGKGIRSRLPDRADVVVNE